MNKTELATKLTVTEEVDDEFILANGFDVTLEDFDSRQTYLIKLYSEYVSANEEAAEARKGFRYQDGEEMVDKSKQYEAYRRYALDLYNRWKEELDEYNDDKDAGGSFFVLRNRAGWLNERNRY